ncbi:MAG: hypothetical protein O2963_01480, partial [Proteobacteria bacterium]|nr:hypothetical protein [Pseudomonadota bacterium]
SIAIDYRYKRCKEHWDSHLNKCKTFIIDALKNIPDGSKVVIIGSGGLYDVPIEVLIEHKMEITCIDIVHQTHAKRKARNFKFIAQDITSLIKPVYYYIEHNEPLPDSFDPQVIFPYKADLIISLNILSQLPINMMRYAEEKNRPLPESFEHDVIKVHLHWLFDQKTAIVLISDIERKYFKDKDYSSTEKALPNLETLQNPLDQWQWDLAPAGEIDKNMHVTHTVGAWRL